MLQSIWDDVKREFSYGNMVTRIIIVNVVIYVVVNIVWIIARISNQWMTPEWYTKFMQFFMMSSDWLHNLTHPWVIITSMFLHEGFWHILWNMLFMYWFGRIVGDFIGNQRILPLYLLGGILGGIVYFLSLNLLPYGGEGAHYALGASAAVMAIVVAAGAIAPDYVMRLLFLGDVKLKYIVAVLVFIDLVGMAGDINTGGHFAHLGGALFGWLFVVQLRSGNDWSAPVNNFLDSISSFFSNLFSGNRGGRPKVVYRNPNRTRSRANSRSSSRGEASSDSNGKGYQERLDAILDKIKKSGYDSLSKEEKEFLFNASKK
ncbi:MAG: rhomboid family intramembrane serine protease [Phaeodactylibacter sp.]|nr:rhomboid family intramembrane serine protease [Phaeodactylibacter sp.]MCB9052953.1 rhomboid family intramembrane serine protease [Lewinellaceae bacterium]